MLRGDQRSFDLFFESYAARLGSFAARRCALDPSAIEDVVQTTLIKAIRGLKSFRGDSSLYTWLCRICRNQLMDVSRKAIRQPDVSSLDSMIAAGSARLPVQLIDARDPLDECVQDSTRNSIRRAINLLHPRYVRILELRYGDGAPLAEIAQILGLSESATQSLLARARRAFGAVWDAGGAGTAESGDTRSECRERSE
jgi:RNA polymerase sigma-70 factor (ECF subfamily)